MSARLGHMALAGCALGFVFTTACWLGSHERSEHERASAVRDELREGSNLVRLLGTAASATAIGAKDGHAAGLMAAASVRTSLEALEPTREREIVVLDTGGRWMERLGSRGREVTSRHVDFAGIISSAERGRVGFQSAYDMLGTRKHYTYYGLEEAPVVLAVEHVPDPARMQRTWTGRLLATASLLFFVIFSALLLQSWRRARSCEVGVGLQVLGGTMGLASKR